jgi:Histone methylation protein DOT1
MASMVDVSTILNPEGSSEVSPPERLRFLLQRLEGNSLLFQQNSLSERLLAMDEIDALAGGTASTMSEAAAFAEIERRALTLQHRLESANAELYQFIRTEILRGQMQPIFRWLDDLNPEVGNALPYPGLGFDARDDFMASLFQQSDPGDVSSLGSREMIAYQPTPVRHVLHLLKTVTLSDDDLFVDLGSGMGHVPLMMSMLAGVRSLGIEIEPAYVANAERCARTLQLENASFVAADARDADFSVGTIFYLYSPFTGSILKQVLGRLREQSLTRPIKVCSLGPCTCDLAKERWLKTSGPLDPNRITVFESQ